MKVLHILDHSLPYLSGYSIRSDYIIRHQRRKGLHPVVVTSPNHEVFTTRYEKIDDVDYFRLHWPSFSLSPQISQRLKGVSLLRQMSWIAVLTKEITRVVQEMRVDLIHAHSPSLNGLAAARAAKQLGLPWVYELRYYDEDAAVDRGKFRYNSLRYRMSQRLEHSALEQAGTIVTISSALREDLIKRGIKESNIVEVPNGVDTELFQPREPDRELIAKYDLAGKTVIGYIGSIKNYEGLEFLLDAILLLIREHSGLKLLLAGEGKAEEGLRARIPAKFRESLIFMGSVPHDQVQRYYSVMDILVYPRIRSRLTELTTPLKPLEAMAMGKVVIGSDVGGIRELVKDGETGFLVEAEDSQKIAGCLAKILRDVSLLAAVGHRAREFVKQERDWGRITEKYLKIYQ